MSHDLPSFLEDEISQISALQMLQNLGWKYLTPEEAVSLRGRRLSNVILESVLVDQHRKPATPPQQPLRGRSLPVSRVQQDCL